MKKFTKASVTFAVAAIVGVTGAFALETNNSEEIAGWGPRIKFVEQTAGWGPRIKFVEQTAGWGPRIKFVDQQVA